MTTSITSAPHARALAGPWAWFITDVYGVGSAELESVITRQFDAVDHAITQNTPTGAAVLELKDGTEAARGLMIFGKILKDFRL